jgi:hypothetical protein
LTPLRARWEYPSSYFPGFSVEHQEKDRKPVPKRGRFEVFKRDSFKCQYCGAAAPKVLLQIDHIQPVSKDGDNDITNLITACNSCNSGKSNLTLGDRTALAKSRAQLEELQERREQLEMMMEWRRGLRDLAGDSVEMLCEYWYELAPGWIANDYGKRNVKKWLSRYSIEEITAAMDKAAASYLEYNREGNCTSESWNAAFNKIPAICRLDRLAKEQPDLRDLYYIRGIARNRTNYFDDGRAIQLLKAARSWGVGIEELRDVALSCTSWTNFRETIEGLIEERSETEQTDD